ncbi:MAG TPA: hypothetical protein VGO07_01320 [Candidatus Saccharimonadales bacterium]|jgi:hypothetical protein|nr:hypothetical protein [Candidatus Saccharimonadales bacterium]
MLTIESPPLIACQFDGTAVTRHSVAEDSVFPAPQLFPLSDVERTLDGMLDGPEPSPIECMERAVADLATKAQLTYTLAEVVNSRNRLKQIAATSERHPLGFKKIPLISKPAYQLRLNIWDGPVELEDVHPHEFDFASAVLLGRLATRVYDFPSETPVYYGTIPLALEALKSSDEATRAEAQRSLAWHHRQLGRVMRGEPEEYEPRAVSMYRPDRTRSDREAMTSLGQGFARLVGGQTILTAGDFYSLLHTTSHTAHPISAQELTATLFLRGRPIIGRGIIGRIHPSKVGVDIDRPKIRLSPREVKNGVTDIIRACT